jgi:predicted SprT family Zn-dependent metalloprotease
MKIYCAKCRKYLGEIRDAKLRKGTAYLCAECERDLKKVDMPDFMRGLFR